MAKFTREHYAAIAKVVASMRYDYQIGQGMTAEEYESMHDFERGEVSGRLASLSLFCQNIEDVFAADNPRFSRRAFQLACQAEELSDLESEALAHDDDYGRPDNA